MDTFRHKQVEDYPLVGLIQVLMSERYQTFDNPCDTVWYLLLASHLVNLNILDGTQKIRLFDISSGYDIGV